MKSSIIPSSDLQDLILPSWDSTDYTNLLDLLSSLADPVYADFSAKGTFTHYQVIGVRLPILRRIAKTIRKGNYTDFLALADTTFFETVMLRGFVVADLRNFDELMDYFWSQIDLIDDWSLCDSFCNSLWLAKHQPAAFLPLIDTLIHTDEEFKVRVGLVTLLAHFVSESYLPIIFQYLNQIQSDAYYINMAEAWLLCEIIVRFPDAGLDFLDQHHLNDFTLRKTISKVRDSYRVSDDLKNHLKTTYLTNKK